MVKKRIIILKRIISVLLSGTLVLPLPSCKNAPVDDGTQFHYETIYCTDVQATTEIAVVDGKLYCKWLDVQYDESGMRYDTERIDVIENIAKSREWERVSIPNEAEIAISNFDIVYTYPLYEEIGGFAVVTDEHNDFYLLNTETGIQTDLELNLEDWRRFSTDHKMYFAVLSAYAVTVNGEYVHEIRYYKLDGNNTKEELN